MADRARAILTSSREQVGVDCAEDYADQAQETNINDISRRIENRMAKDMKTSKPQTQCFHATQKRSGKRKYIHVFVACSAVFFSRYSRKVYSAPPKERHNRGI